MEDTVESVVCLRN